MILAVSAWGQSVGGPTEGQENKLLVLEQAWNDAQVHRDSKALAGLIADRFINTEYDGEVSDREHFLADIANPEYQPSSVNIRDLHVNLYRNTAVITGVYHAKGMFNGKNYDHLGRFTDTWISEGGRWMCVASHTSLLKK